MNVYEIFKIPLEELCAPQVVDHEKGKNIRLGKIFLFFSYDLLMRYEQM